MKEAAGEANLTVVAIILIGVIVAVATPIVKNMMDNTQKRANCMNDGGCWSDGDCDYSCGDTDGGTGSGSATGTVTEG